MYIYQDGVIYIPYGDSAQISVKLTENGEPYMLGENEQLKIDIIDAGKNDILISGSGTCADQETDGTVSVRIGAAGAAPLTGRYRAAVRLCNSGSDSSDTLLGYSSPLYVEIG